MEVYHLEQSNRADSLKEILQKLSHDGVQAWDAWMEQNFSGTRSVMLMGDCCGARHWNLTPSDFPACDFGVFFASIQKKEETLTVRGWLGL